jgi:hypothetical protein
LFGRLIIQIFGGRLLHFSQAVGAHIKRNEHGRRHRYNYLIEHIYHC